MMRPMSWAAHRLCRTHKHPQLVSMTSRMCLKQGLAPGLFTTAMVDRSVTQVSRSMATHTAPEKSISSVKVQKSDPASYASAVDKKAQAKRVEAILESNGMIPRDRVHSEVAWFYESLGIDITYFILENAETIAGHIVSLYAAKISEYAKHTGHIKIDLQKRSDDSAVFIHSSDPGVSTIDTLWERRIDSEYLNKPTLDRAFRLESYRSSGLLTENAPEQLRCHFLQKCQFAEPVPDLSSEQAQDIRAVSDKTFLTKTSDHVLDIYQNVMRQALKNDGPAIEVFKVDDSTEHHVVIGYRMGTTSNFFSAMTDLYHYYGLYSTRKYVEHFSNGITIMSIYLNPLPPTDTPSVDMSILRVLEEVSLIYALPDNPFFTANGSGKSLTVQEATYAYVGWLFAQHFCNRLGTAYEALREIIDESNSHHAAVLHDIKMRLREETFTRQSIFEVIRNFPEVTRLLYARFAYLHYSDQTPATGIEPSAHEKLMPDVPLSDQELYDVIIKSASNSHERQVLLALLAFNKSVLKTNFYTPTKVALSFRLDPSFLPESEYPVKPYGIFFVVGSDFRGFHVRFRDVSRGGIRIIRSRNKENYSINQRTLFDENYGLARTQHLKNKDIPEGGAKGTILPDMGAEPSRCFEKYVDSILDLLVQPTSSGAKQPIVDFVGKEEILFFGPDEGTADLMDWGAEHARKRGAPWWKSFTTGKTASALGGVPHDVFGMTSLSVRQYIHGIIRMLGLKEQEVTKVQTGGPDGDLGSNEILQSKDKTVAIIDGSGVIHDPHGLDREELVHLAKERKTISHFDPSKLSKDGYRVLVEDRNLKLPSGEVVPDGFNFRNGAHLRYKADLFVPCGGRPESINVTNVQQLIKGETTNYKYIVEGANLFITRQARLELEKNGVILYPDASANKGGVTSSSLEVLVGLSLTDEEYIQNMLFVDGKPTPFYMNYVRDIQSIIARNARGEFEAIWRENEETGKPRSFVSTDLSRSLNLLSLEIEKTNLFEQDTLRNTILKLVFPQSLVAKVGLDELVRRVPESYLKSAFAAQVAAGFIYAKGPRASHVDFYDHISALLQGSS